MPEFLDPKMNQIVNQKVEKDPIEKKETLINSITDAPIDWESLAEREKLSIEDRLKFLEVENERRVQEISILAMNHKVIVFKFWPMVKKVYDHFFNMNDDGK